MEEKKKRKSLLTGRGENRSVSLSDQRRASLTSAENKNNVLAISESTLPSSFFREGRRLLRVL